ncbi:MAG: class I SAM-dependent methyltransferase [Planctomycetota bacterium]
MGMTFDGEPFRAIDAWVYEHPTRSDRGFHGDHVRGPTYAPAIQQVRAEWYAFLELCRRPDLAGGRAVEIGLGRHGGTHFSLTRVFDQVVTVEADVALIERYRHHNPVDPRRDVFVAGNSQDAATLRAVTATVGQADVLFIDGGHRFDEVRTDWIHWRHVVRPGGVIAFHDAVERDNKDAVNVHRFLEWMRREHGVSTHRIGSELGIAWYEQPGSAEPELPLVERHEGFAIHRSAAPGSPVCLAVPSDGMPVRLTDVRGGDVPMHLVAGDAASLRDAIAVFTAARPALERARALLAAGSVQEARAAAAAIRRTWPALRGCLDAALAFADRSCELLAFSAVLGLPDADYVIPRLCRASERDPMSEEKLWLIAHSVREAGGDGKLDSRTAVELLTRVVPKLRDLRFR